MERGLSKCSLQRRLLEENVTFRKLPDPCRREQACATLSAGERGIGAISYALGYSDQSSFNRAVRRWTGTTPGLRLRNRVPAAWNRIAPEARYATRPHGNCCIILQNCL